jgi:hypothetical protein
MQATWLITVVWGQLRALRLLYFRAVWRPLARLDLLIHRQRPACSCNVSGGPPILVPFHALSDRNLKTP